MKNHMAVGRAKVKVGVRGSGSRSAGKSSTSQPFPPEGSRLVVCEVGDALDTSLWRPRFTIPTYTWVYLPRAGLARISRPGQADPVCVRRRGLVFCREGLCKGTCKPWLPPSTRGHRSPPPRRPARRAASSLPAARCERAVPPRERGWNRWNGPVGNGREVGRGLDA